MQCIKLWFHLQYNTYHSCFDSVVFVSTGYSNSLEQVEIIKEVIAELPSHNRLMLGWLMVHMSHIVENVSGIALLVYCILWEET